MEMIDAKITVVCLFILVSSSVNLAFATQEFDLIVQVDGEDFKLTMRSNNRIVVQEDQVRVSDEVGHRTLKSKQSLLDYGFKKLNIGTDLELRSLSRLRNLVVTMNALYSPDGLERLVTQRGKAEPDPFRVDLVSLSGKKGDSIFFGQFGHCLKNVEVTSNKIKIFDESKEIAEFESFEAIQSWLRSDIDRSDKPGESFFNTVCGYSKYGIVCVTGKPAESHAIRELSFQTIVLEHLIELPVRLKAKKNEE